MKTPCLILALVASVATAFAVDPPPDGGYPNQNTAEGEDALFTLNTVLATSNTGIGYHSLFATGEGDFNSAVGALALASNTASSNNTAVGYSALSIENCYACSDNTAVGYRAMANASSYACVAVGSEALVANTGQLNTAVGVRSMENNTSGQNNTAIGWASMNHNTTGSNNAAVGLDALSFITTGNSNSVLGSGGAVYTTSGSNLAAIGYEALFSNTTGNDNTALGYFSLYSNLTGSRNVAVGKNAGYDTTGDDNIDIANLGIAGESGTIRIGTSGTHNAVYIAGIRTTPLTRGRFVGWRRFQWSVRC